MVPVHPRYSLQLCEALSFLEHACTVQRSLHAQHTVADAVCHMRYVFAACVSHTVRVSHAVRVCSLCVTCGACLQPAGPDKLPQPKLPFPFTRRMACQHTTGRAGSCVLCTSTRTMQCPVGAINGKGSTREVSPQGACCCAAHIRWGWKHADRPSHKGCRP